MRPLNGQLYALGKTSRLYVINPRTAAARQVGATPFIPALAGASFGFDFNPTVDRIRVTSDAEQNLRLNPDDGTVTGVDANLAYAPGDPGAGTNPNVGGSAYTNSFAGATSTSLFDIDNARHALVIQSPPNDGTLTTVGALGTTSNAVAFDVGNGADRPDRRFEFVLLPSMVLFGTVLVCAVTVLKAAHLLIEVARLSP